MSRPDLLAPYVAKRDFTRTAEPRGQVCRGGGNSFVVQKHDATRLHWDFRIEVDGVLKSWAVTRGPSRNPADKRLAVRTEDHPLDYGTFEGSIPKGEYGGGTVMLWDRGTWEPVAGKSAADLDAGHLHFTLHGERMQGEWLLIRLPRRGKEKRENWLLRKIADAHAGSSDDLVDRMLTSVATGRSMQEIAAGAKPRQPAGKSARSAAGPEKSKSKRRRSRAKNPPAFAPVQLATLVDHAPVGGDWLHETKYDGYRGLLAVGGGQARIYTRTGLDWSDKFPRLIAAATALRVDSALIDGEIVVLDADGRPSFSALQDAISAGDPAALFFAFDVLHCDGRDLTELTTIERKERLRPLIPAEGPLHFSEHVIGSGDALFAAMCAAGMEGIISKRADARYLGKRTKAWLKVKCTSRQEFVILGWTDSSARMRGFGALLVGTTVDGELRYAGKVGTGFSADSIAAIRARLDAIGTREPAAAIPSAARRGAHWVRPELVAEIAYAELTSGGILRHASFIALRGDKPAAAVRLEQPVPGPTGDDVPITNADRVIFPECGITKGALAAYYDQLSALVLATAAGRPLSLVRCPEGRAKQCFFQRHGARNLGDAIRTVDVVGKDGDTRAYLYIDNRTGLLETVQMGSIELHGWGAKADDIERPDRLIFDLDPDPALGFDAVRRGARMIRKHLADLGLISFAMLSGGKGVHVVVPLTPGPDWPVVTDFARRFAQSLSALEPDRYVATMAKAKREGRIFIDWLRNQRGSTAVLPYSVRAREGAPVAAPIAWEELDSVSKGGEYALTDAAQLMERATSGALAGWGQADQILPDV